MSIIVPIYNAENYLNECISSIINQTYRNIEVLLIEDGSTDASLDICKEWSKRDSRIKVWHQKNKGVSGARNKGLEIASGNYILFVDADDYVDENYVRSLYEKQALADIVICGYCKVNSENKTSVLLQKDGFLGREDVFFHTVCTNVIHGACWNKMFRASVLRKNSIIFRENIAIGEDLVFVTEYLQYCSTCYYINRALYFYRKNGQSAMNSTYMTRKFDKRNISVLECVSELKKLTENENRVIQRYIGYRAVRSSIRLMLQMVLGENKNQLVFKEIKINCRTNYGRFIRVKEGSRLEKAVGLLLGFSPTMVYQICRVAINNKLLLLEKYIA